LKVVHDEFEAFHHVVALPASPGAALKDSIYPGGCGRHGVAFPASVCCGATLKEVPHCEIFEDDVVALSAFAGLN